MWEVADRRLNAAQKGRNGGRREKPQLPFPAILAEGGGGFCRYCTRFQENVLNKCSSGPLVAVIASKTGF